MIADRYRLVEMVPIRGDAARPPAARIARFGACPQRAGVLVAAALVRNVPNVGFDPPDTVIVDHPAGSSDPQSSGHRHAEGQIHRLPGLNWAGCHRVHLPPGGWGVNAHGQRATGTRRRNAPFVHAAGRWRASWTAKARESRDPQLLTGVLPEPPVLNALSRLGRTHG
jgi:hypothetical protein